MTLRRQLAASAQQHHGQAGDPTSGVGEQLKARAVGAWMSSNTTSSGRSARCPLQQRDDRLEQTRALQVGRDSWSSACHCAPKCAGSSLVSVVRSSGHAVSAGGAGSAGSSSRTSSAHRLSGAVPPRSSAAQAALSAPTEFGALAQLARQARLADPGLAADHCGGAVPGARRIPHLLELAELRLAPHERKRPGERTEPSRRRLPEAARSAAARSARAFSARAQPAAPGAGAPRAHGRRAARPARSPAAPRRAISRRAASSSSGSRSTCRRVHSIAARASPRSSRPRSELLQQLDHTLAVPCRARAAPIRPRVPRAARRGRARAPARTRASASQALELAHVHPQRVSSRSPTRSPSTTSHSPARGAAPTVRCAGWPGHSARAHRARSARRGRSARRCQSQSERCEQRPWALRGPRGDRLPRSAQPPCHPIGARSAQHVKATAVRV